VRTAYPQFAYCYSGWGVEPRSAASPELGFLNLLEPHIWLAQQRGYYQRVGYGYERFDAKGYENVVAHAEAVYRANPEYWLDGLRDAITRVADSSSTWNLPLITTECWGLVDYKDWPGLDWGYVKEMCAVGTTSAAATGRWVALATSNFCGPQFRGMWRDIAWHQRLTKMIKASRLPEL
ncbi:MAG: cellulase-like family protein, partial [Verrucomicrobiota bacterium]